MQKKIISFILSLGSAIALTLILKEPQFSDAQTYVLFLLFFSIGLWVTEAIPPFSVGLFIIAFLVFSLGNKWFNAEPRDIARYANTFSSSVIWLLLGGFFLASGLTKTGLDARLLGFALKASGPQPRRLLLGLMLTTMCGSMLMSNSATTSMILAAVTPLLTGLGKKSNIAKAIVLGVALAASVGGMGTLIGTPPNLIAAGALENAGISVDFLHWMYYGIPLALVLTAIGYVAINMLYMKEAGGITLELPSGGDAKAGAGGSPLRRNIVLVVLIVTVLLWMTSSLHHLSVAAVAAIPIVFLTMTGIVDAKDIRALPWDTLLLVAGGLSLGLALQDTGLLTHFGGKIVSLGLSPVALLAVMSFLTMMVSNFMSHTAASSLLIPLGMAILPDRRLEMALIIGFASSTSMLLPVSTPPNAIAYSTGVVDQKDLIKLGIIMGLLGSALVTVCVLLIS